jgi:hypothetical protein
MPHTLQRPDRRSVDGALASLGAPAQVMNLTFFRSVFGVEADVFEAKALSSGSIADQSMERGRIYEQAPQPQGGCGQAGHSGRQLWHQLYGYAAKTIAAIESDIQEAYPDWKCGALSPAHDHQ